MSRYDCTDGLQLQATGLTFGKKTLILVYIQVTIGVKYAPEQQKYDTIWNFLSISEHFLQILNSFSTIFLENEETGINVGRRSLCLSALVCFMTSINSRILRRQLNSKAYESRVHVLIEALQWQLFGRTEENHKKYRENRRPGRDLNETSTK